MRKKSLSIIVLLSFVLMLTGCNRWYVAPDAKVRYYHIPQWGVVASYDEEMLVVLTDEAACATGGHSFTVKGGYGCGDGLVLYCDDLTRVQSVSLLIGDKPINGYVDQQNRKLSFSGEAFSLASLAQSPVTLRLNDDATGTVQLSLAKAAAVTDPSELGQVTTAEGVTALLIPDADGRGLIIAAFNDEPLLADAAVTPESLLAYDHAGRVYDLAPEKTYHYVDQYPRQIPLQHYDLPHALWHDVAAVTMQDARITYNQRSLRQIGVDPLLAIKLPPGQQAGQLDGTWQLGPYSAQLLSINTTAIQSPDDTLQLSLWMPKESSRYLYQLHPARLYTDGWSSATMLTETGLSASYYIDLDYILRDTLCLYLESFDVKQEGAWGFAW